MRCLNTGLCQFPLSELCGTPGYLAPEILKCSMDETHEGYGKEVDLWVNNTHILLSNLSFESQKHCGWFIVPCFPTGGLVVWSCSPFLLGLHRSGIANSCWCWEWSWKAGTSLVLQSGMTGLTPSKTWWDALHCLKASSHQGRWL